MRQYILPISIICCMGASGLAYSQTTSTTPSQAACQASKVPVAGQSGAIANANSTKQLTGSSQPGSGGLFNAGGTTSGYNSIGSKTTANGSTTGSVATGQAPAPNCP